MWGWPHGTEGSLRDSQKSRHSLQCKNARWAWSEEQQEFMKLKKKLISLPVLASPDFSRQFLLQTDASTSGLGAVLTQMHEDGERVIAYASRTLNKAECNYSATELECLVVVWGIRKMKSYLEDYKFTVVTDHQALKSLQRIESPTGRLRRWIFKLQQRVRNKILARDIKSGRRRPLAIQKQRR